MIFYIIDLVHKLLQKPINLITFSLMLLSKAKNRVVLLHVETKETILFMIITVDLLIHAIEISEYWPHMDDYARKMMHSIKIGRKFSTGFKRVP